MSNVCSIPEFRIGGRPPLAISFLPPAGGMVSIGQEGRIYPVRLNMGFSAYD